MGCCVSSIDKKNPPPPPSPPPHLHKHSSFSKSSSRAPPPPPPPVPLEEEEEEETVKEVLSETPNPKPSSYPLPKIEHQPRKIPPKHDLHEIQSPVKNIGFKKPSSNSINPNPTAEEVSEEMSEICSESVSTTTTAFNNDVSGEVRQRSPAKYRNNRSGSGELSRERAVGKSPARGSVQSPGRVRSMNGRDSRRVVAARGETSGPGQRYGSPANRTGGGGDGARNGVGRSSSVRKTGKSPGRVGSDLNRRGEPTKNTNESLENPLVSLECFIFL